VIQLVLAHFPYNFKSAIANSMLLCQKSHIDAVFESNPYHGIIVMIVLIAGYGRRAD